MSDAQELSMRPARRENSNIPIVRFFIFYRFAKLGVAQFLKTPAREKARQKTVLSLIYRRSLSR